MLGYTDIRDCSNRVLIQPGESISVASNKRITLGGNTAALILPRITLSDSGILSIVAYIDAYWDGTLQMVLTNSTRRLQQLSLLEPIAQCYFFDLPDGVDIVFREQFPRKSHHYGQNWDKILSEDAEPFPLRKRAVEAVSTVDRLTIMIAEYWTAYAPYAKAALALLLIVFGFSGWLAVMGAIRSVPEMKSKLERLSPYFENASDFNIPALRQSISEVQARLPSSGTASIDIPQGASAGEATVTIDRPLSGSSVFVPALSRPLPGSNLEAIPVILSGTHAVFRVRLELERAVRAATSAQVKWILIP